MEECPIDLYRDTILVGDSSARQTPVQYLLDQIVSSMMEKRSLYLGSNFQERVAALDISQKKIYFERKLKKLIQSKEIEILQANDWNLRLSNGFDILSMLLKYCNESYNFENIMMAISKLSTAHMFKGK